MSVSINKINSFIRNLYDRASISTSSLNASAQDSIRKFLALNLSKIGLREGEDEGNKGEVKGFNLKSLTQETSSVEALNLGEGLVYHDGINSNGYQANGYDFLPSEQLNKVEVAWDAADVTPVVDVIARGMTGDFFTPTPVVVSYSMIEGNFSSNSTGSSGMRGYPNRMVFAGAPEDVEANIRIAQNLASVRPRQSDFSRRMAKEISQVSE
jgi:hypothetical protein